ncbi:hypothetical protein I6A60_20340 [Frankia sp. AgB1.9]|uniref:hypothetical protein n=1 Tax=unclassified Frankia TaxID=2632575 RepID=UPI0019330E3C|nr:MULTISPECIES: hypothetical protein [unclassified Frankia]MBL7491922.1 hypothetical protein [Frankia sp. AgW1.1]MBL7550211.1 hypothetical protein [Frankia sp. AgB1.9]MBL7619870.1 hypothetical protein [Frankia sp. AgB1.8]
MSPDDPWGGSGGLLLRDVLADNEGRYEHHLHLPERTKNRLRELTRLTGDSRPAQIAEADATTISLDHLRHLDPDTTRVRIGLEIRWEPGDDPWPEPDL